MALFSICRRCDRGNVYCGLTCRRTARRATSREARRRHRRSEEGRLDHRDHERARRARRRRVGDHGPGKLSRSTTLDEPDRARVSMTESDVSTGQVNDERHDHGHNRAGARPGSAAGDDTVTRPSASDSRPDACSAPTCGGDLARRSRPLASAPAVRCARCGRRGRWHRLGPLRRPRRRADAALRSRPRVPGSRRAPPPPPS